MINLFRFIEELKFAREIIVYENVSRIAKALYRKENKELVSTIDRYTDGLVFTMKMQEIIETLSAAKAPKKDGKGSPYADRFNGRVPLFEAMQTASRKAFKRAFGY